MNDPIIIVGSGIAALAAADVLCKKRNVIIFTKSTKTDSNSSLAQGGIAAAIDTHDSCEAHFADTLAAACQHANPDQVALLVKHGPECITEWINKGMNFDKDENGAFDLAQEGAHHHRRILHSGGDATGRQFIELMLARLANEPNVLFLENEMVFDLVITDEGNCQGVLVKDANGNLHAYEANAVILATGGAGSLYACTSNHVNATGDGIAMAYRAGAEIADMEFIQFHPTILHKQGNSYGLVSEAVRGEGAILRDETGFAIMEDIHPLKDLAPRDIVAREIHKQIAGGHEIYLDASTIKNFSTRFPTINALCQKQSINPETDPLPVMPGAHFMMGGIKADPHGATTVHGLFAVGECACTGVHGANRLASNSLLEGLVFGSLTAKHILKAEIHENQPIHTRTIEKNKKTILLPQKEDIQLKMMLYAGVLRNERQLSKLINWLEQFDFHHIELRKYSKDKIEIINMLTVSWLIATSAYMRLESRGGHFRSDYPEVDATWQQKQLIRHFTEIRPVNAIL